ncbi:MAG: hypothetical protein C4291_02150 [Candidatus Dadabacteria bacterium]
MEKYAEFRAANSRETEGLKSQGIRNAKLIYFLIGCGVGAAGALLLSSKFGKEIGEKVSDTALAFGSKLGSNLKEQINRSTERGRDMIDAVVEEAKGAIVRGTNQLSEVIEEAKDALVKSVERLSEAIETGKRAYKEEKNKAEKGEARDGAV